MAFVLIQDLLAAKLHELPLPVRIPSSAIFGLWDHNVAMRLVTLEEDWILWGTYISGTEGSLFVGAEYHIKFLFRVGR